MLNDRVRAPRGEYKISKVLDGGYTVSELPDQRAGINSCLPVYASSSVDDALKYVREKLEASGGDARAPLPGL